jgi:virulence-associated protein VagC
MTTAKLFRHGQCQVARSPKAFRFERDAVRIKNSAGAVVQISIVNAWNSLVGRAGRFAKECLADRDQPG